MRHPQESELEMFCFFSLHEFIREFSTRWISLAFPLKNFSRVPSIVPPEILSGISSGVLVPIPNPSRCSIPNPPEVQVPTLDSAGVP